MLMNFDRIMSSHISAIFSSIHLSTSLVFPNFNLLIIIVSREIWAATVEYYNFLIYKVYNGIITMILMTGPKI